MFEFMRTPSDSLGGLYPFCSCKCSAIPSANGDVEGTVVGSAQSLPLSELRDQTNEELRNAGSVEHLAPQETLVTPRLESMISAGIAHKTLSGRI